VEPDIERRAGAIVDDYAGEGPIALPELRESLERALGLESGDATDLSVSVLCEYFAAHRIQVHRGRYLDSDLPVIAESEARELLEQRVAYVYGDGHEIRTWFSVEPP
jgi:hypothetical protein